MILASITLRRRIPHRIVIASAIAAVLGVFSYGCGESSPGVSGGSGGGDTPADASHHDAADQIAAARARIAEAIVGGSEYDEVRIEAVSFDPVSGMLRDLRVTSPDSLLSAERAEIRINLADQTAQLILFDVVAASASNDPDASPTSDDSDDEDDGILTTYQSLELDPFPIDE